MICSFQIDTEVVPVAELRGHEDAVQAVVFDPNGKFMVSGSSDSTFRVWGDLEETPPPSEGYVSMKQNPVHFQLSLCLVPCANSVKFRNKALSSRSIA
jgi:WD40 repeat protein